MLKVMGLIQRRGDLPLDLFRLHWRTIHRGLALRIAEAGILKGYVQNHRIDVPADGLNTVADGVPELWFDSADSFAALRVAPAFKEGAFHDEPNFMNIGDYRSQPLTEEVGIGATRAECVGLLKAILFLRTGERGMSTDGAVRVAEQTAPDVSLDIKIAPYAAVQTSWWSDAASFHAAWNREGRSFDGLIAEERPVFWPGETPPPADWRPIAQTRV